MLPVRASHGRRLRLPAKPPLGLDHVKPADVAEFARVEGGNRPAALQSRRGDDKVVRADHQAGSRELRPNSRVNAGHTHVHGDDFEAPEKPLRPSAAAARARAAPASTSIPNHNSLNVITLTATGSGRLQ